MGRRNAAPFGVMLEFADKRLEDAFTLHEAAKTRKQAIIAEGLAAFLWTATLVRSMLYFTISHSAWTPRIFITVLFACGATVGHLWALAILTQPLQTHRHNRVKVLSAYASVLACMACSIFARHKEVFLRSPAPLLICRNVLLAMGMRRLYVLGRLHFLNLLCFSIQELDLLFQFGWTLRHLAKDYAVILLGTEALLLTCTALSEARLRHDFLREQGLDAGALSAFWVACLWLRRQLERAALRLGGETGAEGRPGKGVEPRAGRGDRGGGPGLQAPHVGAREDKKGA